MRSDFLEEIFLILQREGVRVHHLEEQTLIALEPLIEPPLLVVILHRIQFVPVLVAPVTRILTNCGPPFSGKACVAGSTLLPPH